MGRDMMHSVILSLDLQQAFELEATLYIKSLLEGCFGTPRKSLLLSRVDIVMKFKRISIDPQTWCEAFSTFENSAFISRC